MDGYLGLRAWMEGAAGLSCGWLLVEMPICFVSSLEMISIILVKSGHTYVAILSFHK